MAVGFSFTALFTGKSMFKSTGASGVAYGNFCPSDKGKHHGFQFAFILLEQVEVKGESSLNRHCLQSVIE